MIEFSGFCKILYDYSNITHILHYQKLKSWRALQQQNIKYNVQSLHMPVEMVQPNKTEHAVHSYAAGPG